MFINRSDYNLRLAYKRALMKQCHGGLASFLVMWHSDRCRKNFNRGSARNFPTGLTLPTGAEIGVFRVR